MAPITALSVQRAQWGDVEFDLAAAGLFAEPLPEPAVGSHPAAHA